MADVSQEALAELHPIEREMIAADQAAQAAGTQMTLDQLGEIHARIVAERHKRLARDAHASWRAMEGWGNVTTQEEWQAAVIQADEDYDNGQFLLSRLGAQRYLDPPLTAVLLSLRRRLIEEHGAATAAEVMMVDTVVLAYYHQMRVTGWIGDFSQWLEAEFFRKGSLGVRMHELGEGKSGVKVRGLRVEEIVERLAEKLMPLLDRSNRMMLRNLKALREYRRPPPPLLRRPARSAFGLTESQRCDECTETVASDDGGAGRPPDREVGAYAARRPGGRPPGTDGGIMAHALRYYLDLLALRAGKGQGLVEYALIIVLISIVSIAIMTTLGGSISSVFSTANTALTTP